jgi:hypothetical protein
MLGRSDLWKMDRLRSVRLVAALAQSCPGQFPGLHHARIVGVLRQRTVAGLAGNAPVFSFRARRRNFVMAHRARGLTGERDRTGAYLIERRCPVMAVLTECLGNEDLPEQQKDSNSSEDDEHQRDEVRYLLEAAEHSPSFSTTGYIKDIKVLIAICQ